MCMALNGLILFMIRGFGEISRCLEMFIHRSFGCPKHCTVRNISKKVQLYLTVFHTTTFHFVPGTILSRNPYASLSNVINIYDLS